MDTEFDWIKKGYGRIKPQTKVCFMVALAAGFLTHLYMLTHKLPNWDDITCFSNAGQTTSAGRWLMEYLKDIPTKWSNPWLNGSVAIFLLAVVCVSLLSVLKLESMTAAVLVPVLIMTFPSVASTMTFMFTVDLYMAGLLFAVLSVYVTNRYRYGFLAGIVLSICSLGIYQAYICFTITLFLFCVIRETIEKTEGKELLKQCVKAVAVLAAGVLLYICVTKLLCPNMADNSYAGVAEMGQISLPELPRLIARSYKRILEYFVLKPFSFISTAGQAVNICVCVLLAGCFVYLTVQKKLWRKKLPFAIGVLAALTAPLGMAFIYVMSPKASFSTLMMYQYVLLYVLLLVLAEQVVKTSGKAMLKKAVTGMTAVLLLLTGVFHYTVTQEAYFRMDMSMERVTAYYNRLLVRLEAEGYTQGEAFLILGHSQAGDELLLPPEYYEMDDEKFADFSGISPEYGILTAGVRENFLRIYFGLDVPWKSDEEKNAILFSEEFQRMPVYPKEGCVQKIDDTWVIKISEGQE